MASYYVYSGAAGSGTGADWANAKTTLAAAFSAMAAGDTAYVADDHAETQASAMTLTSPGTAASPCVVLCVLRSGGSVPPVSADLRTTATVTTTGSNAISFGGQFTHYYGISFVAASGSGSVSTMMGWTAVTAPFHIRMEQCLLKTTNTNGSNKFTFGHSSGGGQRDQLLELVDTDMEFAAAGQGWTLTSGRFRWQGSGSSLLGTIPTTLFTPSSTTGMNEVTLRGVDLSAAGSGITLFYVSSAITGNYELINCKLGSSVTVASGTPAGPGGIRLRMVNCDSADTNYRYALHCYQGTITQETTIVRSGGASDGTTSVSRKMVSTANSKFYSPLESDPIVYWNETLSSQTATIEVVTDGVTLTDAEAWLEVEYLGTSGFPISSVASDRSSDILASGSNQTTSSVTWTTTGLASPTKQKLAVTFTPAEKGPVKLRVMLAKASTTMYFCPKADIT